MKASNPVLLLTFTLLAVTEGCGPKIVSNPEVRPSFSELATRCQKWMVGSFANRDQVDKDPSFSAMQLHQCRIWPDDENAIWIYSEEHPAGRGGSPTWQVVYRIRDDLNGGLLLELQTSG